MVCAKEVGCGKDHPDIYLEAARRISAKPESCMVFEDLLQGICSAKRAGMRTCAVLSNNPLQNEREVVAAADCVHSQTGEKRLRTRGSNYYFASGVHGTGSGH